jgi:hypothetical protein
MFKSWEPCCFTKVPDCVQDLDLIISFDSKKKESKEVRPSEATASHSHKTWAEVFSSTLHLLHKGLLISSIMYRCFLKVLCPERRPVTTLDFVLLKDSSSRTRTNWKYKFQRGPFLYLVKSLVTPWLINETSAMLLMLEGLTILSVVTNSSYFIHFI